MAYWPVNTGAARLVATSPLFVKVRDCADEVVFKFCPPKLREVGIQLRCAGVRPVPFSATCACGPLLALPSSVSVPERLPADPGVNAAETVQEAPGAREVPQFVLVRVKSPEDTCGAMSGTATPPEF